MWQTFHSQIPVDEEAEREKAEKEKMPLDECIKYACDARSKTKAKARYVTVCLQDPAEEREGAAGAAEGHVYGRNQQARS